MKQLLILSGKGGTGKTTVASAFIKLAQSKAYADCDVDAPNLHLVNSIDAEAQLSDFYGLPKAHIDNDACIKCGMCRVHCRFSAIRREVVDGSSVKYVVDEFACEGCGVCQLVCPAAAVTYEEAVIGQLKKYQSEDKVFSTAQLKIGSGTTGKLVTEVKKQLLRMLTEEKWAPKKVEANKDVVVIDGSPGIGCPVIASISGVDMVLIVAEPSVSGISDMERIVLTAKKFNVPIAICINKYNTNIDKTKNIEEFCRIQRIKFVGCIPYDSAVDKAQNKGLSIADFDSPAGRAINRVYINTYDLL